MWHQEVLPVPTSSSSALMDSRWRKHHSRVILNLPSTEDANVMETNVMENELQEGHSDREGEQLFSFDQQLFGQPGKTCTGASQVERRQHSCDYLNQMHKGRMSRRNSKLARSPATNERWLECCAVDGGLRGKPTEICGQIVLPKMYQQDVLRQAHEVPMAGHLGREWTLTHIRKQL